MRIAWYSHPAFFEVTLSLLPELARGAQVHLLLEVGPEAWRNAAFDVEPLDLPPGISPALPALEGRLPAPVIQRLATLASASLVVHGSRRSLSPGTAAVDLGLLQHLRRLRPDVLHVEDLDVTPRLPLALPLVRLLLPHTRLVVSVHDPRPHRGEASWRKRLGRRLGLPAASAIVLHGRAELPGFAAREGLPADRLHVVPLAPLDILRAWRQPEETAAASGSDGTAATSVRAPIVLFVGRLSPYKGLETLYAALPRVAASVPGIRCIVAGRPVSGYALPEPPALVMPASVEVRPDYLPTAELVRLIDAAAVVVCPYVDASQSGIVLAAQALGRPVVASAIGNLPEEVRDGIDGLLVPPGDSEALATALERVLRDDGLRARLRAGSGRAVERGGWEAGAAALLAVYASLRGDPPGRATG